MKRLGLLLCLLASAALAQSLPGPANGRTSRGNFLPIPQYRTPGTGAQSYFVDGSLGSDTNNCTASGASACLTIQGALNRIPKLLRDQATVSVAAGTYAGFTISGFGEDTGIQQTNGGLFIDGALVNSTLATGSATGTATGGSAGATSTFGTLVDGAATWTVNDLTGRIITTATPTNTGFIISSNTATTITIVGTWSAPTGATTYAIQDPSVIVTGNVSLPATPTVAAVANRAAIEISGNNLSYREDVIALRNIQVANATAVIGIEVQDNSSSITFTQMQIRPTAATAQALLVNNLSSTGASRVQVQKCDVSLTSSGSGAVVQSATFRSANTLWRNATAASAAAIVLGNVTATAGGAFARVTAISASESTGFLNGWSFPSAFSSGVMNNRITCSGGTGIGVIVGSTTTNAVGTPSTTTVTANNITTCGTGLQVVGTASADIVSMTGAAATTGFSVLNGGIVTFAKAGVTLTAGTNEVNEDSGGATAAFADIAAGTCLGTASQSSRVCGR